MTDMSVEKPGASVSRATRESKIALPILIVLVVFLAAAPWWAGRADMRLMVEIFYYLVLAQMWNLLAGYAGLVSIGQQAYVGIGGYMLFIGTVFLGVHPLAAVIVAGVAAAILALPSGALLFRLRGPYFAIGAWVLAETFRLIFAQVSALGGGSGMSLPTDIVRSIADGRSAREAVVYWTALGLAVGSVVAVYYLLRSRFGLALTAIRDNEEASGSLGVNAWMTKFSIYIIAAFVTGMTGALIFLQKLRISPDAAFSVNDWTAFVIFMVVIGGIGTIEGPIIGVIVFFVLREFAADWGSWYLILLGTVAIVVMLKAPKGVWGYVAERWGLSILPVARRLDLNSVLDPSRKSRH
ncbi:MAG: branched-chain amino acid ABC transporter permease [Alphaproteobacteria bacterium]|nr:branched-chain amino acid ABC transporter permease [Alphaproteobacteria bacterium]